MQFGVIYSFDTSPIRDESDRLPKSQRKRKLWQRTEKGESEYGIPELKHERWSARLTLRQFDRFVRHNDLLADDVETMGSLGAPSPDGISIFPMPAVSFSFNDNDGIYNAYVTPYLEPGDEKLISGLDTKKEAFDEEDWQIVRCWMIERWN